MDTHHLRRRISQPILCAAFALLGTSTRTAHASPTSAAAVRSPPVTVTVDMRAGLATMPSTGLGVNHAIWDSQLGSDVTTDLLSAAGVKMMRYPGGSYGDIYHWADHTAPGGYVAPDTNFDIFMAAVQRAGAQPIIIANYGTGSPEEAAEWVRYANITRNYGARYWEIGNEGYGNGHYGANWEADDHPDKSPSAYAAGVLAYAAAMKAVDPTVKIGAVLTTPAGWPDGVVAGGDSGTWNKTVLSIAGAEIDFVVLHWYPTGSTAAAVLLRPDQISDILYMVRRQLAQYIGAGADDIGIALTEFDSAQGNNTQPGALFAADTYAGLLANGVFTVDWWDVHNGMGTVSTVAGYTDYGDLGLFSSGNCIDSVCEPPFNTPFAPYYALQMINLFARTGDQFIGAGSDHPLISAHAVRRSNGDVAVLLINRDPDNAHPVRLEYTGFTPAREPPTVYSFENGMTSLSSAQSGTPLCQTLSPYSLTLLLLHPLSTRTGAPGAPGRPTISEVTDHSATITWAPSAPGARPVIRYEVYRHVGATSELLGATTATELALSTLQPAERYTLNIVARDGVGGVSWASPPLTLTTRPPLTSRCTIHLADVANWGSGFVASIDLINNAPEPIDGWTLTFEWPTPWQAMAGGWNGDWAEDGSTVSVTNAGFNGFLGENGGTTNIGFVGNYDGPNILPALFTLNGTVCSSD